MTTTPAAVGQVYANELIASKVTGTQGALAPHLDMGSADNSLAVTVCGASAAVPPATLTLANGGASLALSTTAPSIALCAAKGLTLAAPSGVELRSGAADAVKHVAFRGDYQANALAINPDGDFSTVSLSAPGVVTIKSGDTIRLDAPNVVITGRLDGASPTPAVVPVKDMVVTLGARAAGVPDQPDASYDGAGIVLDNAPDNLPAGAASVEQSVRWRARGGLISAAGQPVAPEKASRWEVSGGGLCMRGADGTSFMFVPSNGQLQLFKLVRNADGSETATLLQGLS